MCVCLLPGRLKTLRVQREKEKKVSTQARANQHQGVCVCVYVCVNLNDTIGAKGATAVLLL